ncbi:hypothetical protein ACIGXI_36340 [Kitasatospora aureofaciens]|uniref:hypothetical protein n=1 Tax=Kitasatospora aureofaciens TaxID=1894 RepID=UPI0037C85368
MNISMAALRDVSLSSDEREVLLHILASSLDPSAQWVQKALRGLVKKNLVVKTAHGYRVSPTFAS